MPAITHFSSVSIVCNILISFKFFNFTKQPTFEFCNQHIVDEWGASRGRICRCSCWHYWEVTGDRWHATCDMRWETSDTWKVTGAKWQVTGDNDQILWLRPKLFAGWVRSWLMKLTISSGVRWMPLHIKLIKEIKILLGLSGFIYQTLLPKKGALKMLKASFILEISPDPFPAFSPNWPLGLIWS